MYGTGRPGGYGGASAAYQQSMSGWQSRQGYGMASRGSPSALRPMTTVSAPQTLPYAAPRTIPYAAPQVPLTPAVPLNLGESEAAKVYKKYDEERTRMLAGEYKQLGNLDALAALGAIPNVEGSAVGSIPSVPPVDGSKPPAKQGSLLSTGQGSKPPSKQGSIKSTGSLLGAEVPGADLEVDMDTPLSIVIFGATGDLAKKKLYPAVYQLMFGAPDAPLIPQHTNVVGYGRQKMNLQELIAKQCVNVKGDSKEQFFQQCSYVAGDYSGEDGYAALNKHLTELEKGAKANRIFFFSVPPTIFADVASGLKAKACAPEGGFTRLIIEKPFGRDSESFAELNNITGSLFSENELFRIDHYMGKEVVLNLLTMRFGNQLFEASLNNRNVASVEIVFKENLGTGGRGGYFDKFGIIRDIMQNHLLQVLMWFAMAPPPSLTRDDIQKEKVKLLKAIKTLTVDDCFVGQFTAGIPLNEGDPIEPGYLDDKTVPEGSKCPTYAALAFKINNDTWSGVPFIMRAGKGLDERMAEVRVTFKAKGFNKLVPGQANQFVMRIQPDEAIYLKCMNKQPGWDQKAAVPVLLDMSYASSFSGGYVADAYERMFLNTAKGDGSLFVGSDELVEAWRIFTPLLKQIDGGALEPVLYPFGVRVPEGMDEWSAKYGVTMSQNWQERLMKLGTDGEIEEFFIANAVMNGSEPSMNTDKLKDLVKKAMDGFEPTQKQMDGILRVVDLNGDGSISLDELKAAVSHFATMYHYSESEDHSTFTKGDDQHV
mmetsp:Transcript_83787/g.130743  ORF Transcript_83787/g.130743 Transcript_83787/m.130743 type:complete len:767 (+) Transcript_83787:61-2361(+)|eukprot:CAMPEP_0169228484 /NCGR_PEP_ID=MMETSP1016-20121227/24858_1 /TAXON_ID=342587 /ORGANISM="Karlodinium micrum, Strain CCMP2283" /LENGTH=766 /DNA_ID=CAMNT_0009307265 /DNA_START=56 /DNA_END=2356 /DNA_ORIENTATION=-